MKGRAPQPYGGNSLTATALALFAGLAGSVAFAVAAPDETVAGASSSADRQSQTGEALYASHCAVCHKGGIPRAPHRDWLAKMAPDAVIDALNQGTMQREAAHLSAAQREALTQYLTGVELAGYRPPRGPPVCTGKALEFDLTQAPARAG